MKLYERIDQIIGALRPAFQREATYEWFMLLFWGVLLTSQPPAVTSYLNAIGLSEGYYHRALHWFHSQAFQVDGLCGYWSDWLSDHVYVDYLQGRRLYVGDGIKVGKEGRKMPGVKGLHQESSNVSKPEWIRGHYFSALGLLLRVGKAVFAVPLVFKLHDGIEAVTQAEQRLTLVDKMANLCVAYMRPGSYVLLDAYYASVKVLKPLRQKGLHLITRVRCSTVAYAAFCPCPDKRRGRPRQWGSPIHLQALFAPPKDCFKIQVWLYGQFTTVYYQCFQFVWDRPDAEVLFVLTQLPNGKQLILLSSDTSLTGAQVIQSYGKRFKIELCFRTLIQLLGGFAYQFWLKLLPNSPQFPQNLRLADFSPTQQRHIHRKVEAFERFVNLNAIALGVLQILALECPQTIWQAFPRWFRTHPEHGFPSEQIVRLTLQHQLPMILAKSKSTLLLAKLLVVRSE
jgi:hypothetical protein